MILARFRSKYPMHYHKRFFGIRVLAVIFPFSDLHISNIISWKTVRKCVSVKVVGKVSHIYALILDTNKYKWSILFALIMEWLVSNL